MSTEVNLHMACHIGVFLNWHLNATVMEQTFHRIDRLGQTHAVRWYLLKTPNSYHDNIERLVTMKWMITTSTQSALPDWLQEGTDSLRIKIIRAVIESISRFKKEKPSDNSETQGQTTKLRQTIIARRKKSETVEIKEEDSDVAYRSLGRFGGQDQLARKELDLSHYGNHSATTPTMCRSPVRVHQ